MKALSHADFRTNLQSLLTQLDQEESKRPHHNSYALGIYLNAGNEVAERVEGGESKESAFSDCFNPCRGMHKVARLLGLKLDVDRGHWVKNKEAQNA